MNFKTLILILLVATIIQFSCSTSNEGNSNTTTTELENSNESQTEIHENSGNDSCTKDQTYFENEPKISSQSIQDFLQNFQTLSLPLTLNKWEINKICSEYPQYNKNSIDTIFASSQPYAYYYGMLPDTNNYYGLIYFLGATQGIPPYLVTIDKSGKLISEEGLFCRCGCQASLTLKKCNAYFTISENLKIHSIDSTEEGILDENFHLIDSTVSLVIKKKNGKIDKTGRISFSKQIMIE